jgi:hypothetical protein
MAQVSVLGIDLAKQGFHVVAMDETGTIAWRKRLTRSALLRWPRPPGSASFLVTERVANGETRYHKGL